MNARSSNTAWPRRVVRGAIAVLLVLGAAPFVGAEQRLVRPGRGAAGGVPLPHTVGDENGTSWVIQPFGGWLQQQGNQPVYSQAGILMIDGNQLNVNLNGAARDEQTGEILLENLAAGDMTITRRMSFKLDEGYARIVDVITNPQGQDRTINFGLTTNLNFGVTNGEFVADPKKKGQNIAWLAMTHGQRAAWEMFAAKGSKVAPAVSWQPGNNTSVTSYQLTIPAGKSVGVVHLHGTSATTEQGAKFILDMKDARLLSDLPAEVRRIIVNWPTSQGIFGDFELLRGDLLDVVEMRGGDQFRGTIKETSYKVDTFYGSVELPADRVVGMLSVGQFKPATLLVTSDGEVYGGALAGPHLRIELSSGQALQVPVSQINRVGYRKRPGEPEEWKFEKPMVVLRAGDRVVVALPEAPIDVATRYGMLKLDPRTVAAIVLQDEGQPVHHVRLIDGSRLSGVVTGDVFPMTLAGAAAGKDAKGGVKAAFPASAVRMIQFVSPPEEPDDSKPRVDLSQDDQLIGTLTGKLDLQTSFDTLSINAAEIRSLVREKDSNDVQIVLWDGTAVSGRLQDAMLAVALESGVEMKIPLGLVDEYAQPTPQPSAGTVEQIKGIIAELSAEDWKQRDRAEARLVEIGPVVAGVLKKMAPGLAPEARQRVDSVLKQLEKKAAPPPRPMMPVAPRILDE